METWLTDVKQLRIPRPKFGSMGTSPPTSRHMMRPFEPPRDYNMSSGDEFGSGSSSSGRNSKLQSATEELRQALQDKL